MHQKKFYSMVFDAKSTKSIKWKLLVWSLKPVSVKVEQGQVDLSAMGYVGAAVLPDVACSAQMHLAVVIFNWKGLKLIADLFQRFHRHFFKNGGEKSLTTYSCSRIVSA